MKEQCSTETKIDKLKLATGKRKELTKGQNEDKVTFMSLLGCVAREPFSYQSNQCISTGVGP